MNRLKHILRPTGFKLGLVMTVLALLVYAAGVPFLHMIELKAFDLHLLSRGKRPPGPVVSIIAIDEKSLDAYGRWPWSRKKLAELVDVLKGSGARVVAFDIVFSEPDQSLYLGLLNEITSGGAAEHKDLLPLLEKLEKESGGDRAMVAALKQTPSVILGYYFFFSRDEIGHLGSTADNSGVTATPYLVRRLKPGVRAPALLEAVAVEKNIPEISEAVSLTGYFNTLPDPDGIVRRAPLAVRYGDAIYPHLSVEAVRKYLDAPNAVINVADYGVKSINIGELEIPVDERGYLIINYRGPQKTFPHYSVADVLSGDVPTGTFKDRIVLIGATATGISDMRAAPFAGTFPGVEIHANIIDTMLRGDFVHRPDWVVLFDMLAILLPGIILSVALPRLGALPTAAVTLAMAGAYILLNGYAFRSMGLWMIEVYPVFTIFFVSGGVMVFQFMTAEKKRRQTREAFSRYVAPPLVEEIARSPEKLVLGGEERRLTVLFSDIRGFTSIAEGLSPQVLVRLMNSYFTPMTDVILESGGTIDKYMGDSIMAFWGAPVWYPDHASKACKGALMMREKLFQLKDTWRGMRVRELDIGIGISTGTLTVGNMGSATRFDYTVIGDTVNLGSRLESLNKIYGTHIIVPKYTYEDVKDEFVFRELDLLKVKGKKLPVKIYELMGERGDGGDLDKIAGLFAEGLDAYRRRDWDTAEVYFKTVLEFTPNDGPSRTFMKRVEVLRRLGVPDDWDGIYIETDKTG